MDTTTKKLPAVIFAEAARLLGVKHASNVARWVKEGRLEEAYLEGSGHFRYVTLESLNALAEERRLYPPRPGRKAKGANG